MSLLSAYVWAPTVVADNNRRKDISHVGKNQEYESFQRVFSTPPPPPQKKRENHTLSW